MPKIPESHRPRHDLVDGFELVFDGEDVRLYNGNQVYVESAENRSELIRGLVQFTDLPKWDIVQAVAQVLDAGSAIMARLAGESPKDNRRRPTLIQASSVEPEDVGWLWYPFLPRGKLVIVDGDPGVGKTWLALELAKIISTGEAFPNIVPEMRIQPRQPGRVIYASAEDGVADTLVPRLRAAGADCEQVYILTGWHKDSDETGVVSMQDVDILREAMESIRPDLLVIDPVQAFLGSGVKMSDTNSVRNVLSPIVALAEELRCTVVTLRHLSKGGGDKAIYRGLGSIDFMAACRSALLVGFDPENNSRRIIAHAKSSLAAKGPSLAYRITEGRIAWDGSSDLSAEDLCAPVVHDEEGQSAVDEAQDFLYALLLDGPVEAKVVKKQARDATISEITLKRAKLALSIQSRRISEGSEGAGKWVWELGGHQDDPMAPLDDPLANASEVTEKQEVAGRFQGDHLIPLEQGDNDSENNDFQQGCKGIIQGAPREEWTI